MNAVNWFEIPVTDMKRAKSFYGELLGKPVEDMPSPIPSMQMAAFPMEQNAAGATGALVSAEGYAPRADGTLVYFVCEDVAAALARAESTGGKVLLPKTSIGQWGFIGRVIDSEGNAIGLHSEK